MTTVDVPRVCHRVAHVAVVLHTEVYLKILSFRERLFLGRHRVPRGFTLNIKTNESRVWESFYPNSLAHRSLGVPEGHSYGVSELVYSYENKKKRQKQSVILTMFQKVLVAWTENSESFSIVLLESEPALLEPRKAH